MRSEGAPAASPGQEQRSPGFPIIVIDQGLKAAGPPWRGGQISPRRQALIQQNSRVGIILAATPPRKDRASPLRGSEDRVIVNPRFRCAPPRASIRRPFRARRATSGMCPVAIGASTFAGSVVPMCRHSVVPLFPSSLALISTLENSNSGFEKTSVQLDRNGPAPSNGCTITYEPRIPGRGPTAEWCSPGLVRWVGSPAFGPGSGSCAGVEEHAAAASKEGAGTRNFSSV